jgi:hypothetical protein
MQCAGCALTNQMRREAGDRGSQRLQLFLVCSTGSSPSGGINAGPAIGAAKWAHPVVTCFECKTERNRKMARQQQRFRRSKIAESERHG